jgi:phospholipid/cholesterol/gamma-HCH transport system ATP-binding protein
MNEAPILEIENTHKKFNENSIHSGVTFKLTSGESLGLLGGSGTGKSVLLRSIIGLDYIDSGEIIYRGSRIDQCNEKEYCKLRTKISYAFQSGALFDSLNVFENIATPLFEHTSLSFKEIYLKVKETLKIIDMEGTEKLMPSDLSGGMQKRVGMARSIILNPDIILYDEPTAGLDPANTQNVVNIMRKLKEKGMASIFVTHDIPAALQLCDRLLILNDGKIVFNGTPKEFQSSSDPIVSKFLMNERKNK